MATYRFTVNGVSLLNYIAEDGIKWTRIDVESPDAGRTLDGVHRSSRWKRHPDHVLQQHSHHLRHRQPRRHLSMERADISAD